MYTLKNNAFITNTHTHTHTHKKKTLQSNIIIRSYHTLYGYISKKLIRRRHLKKFINMKNINFFQHKCIHHPRLLSWSLVEIFCFVL